VVYFKAFAACGLLCMLVQMLMVNTRLGFSKLFILVICGGVVLDMFGLVQPMLDFGQAGIIVTVLDAGKAMYTGTLAALNGKPESIINFWIMLGCVFIVSAICGFIKKTPPTR
jgi:hypothetical protein